MTISRHINRKTYLKAKKNLEKLIEGVPIFDEENEEFIGWVEKPDMNAIKYAIDKYAEQLEKKKLLNDLK